MLQTLSNLIDTRRDYLVDVRRHMHRNPELSGSEIKTTQYLADLLRGEELNFTIGPEDRGLIVDLGDPALASKRIALRADIDAIPVHDTKSVNYRSTVDNVMHACGHDAHSTMLLGALILLKHWFDQEPRKHLAVRAIFQPEEENACGAMRLIRHGVLENVSAIMGCHVDSSRPVGEVGYRSGILTAHCDDVTVTISGKSGHAARPHETIDPIATAAQFIQSVYSMVNRAVNSQFPVVLTFGQIIGGHGANVIPDLVTLRGTLRTLDPKARQKTIEVVGDIAGGIAAATGATINADFGLHVPSVVADNDMTELVRSTCEEILGAGKVKPLLRPSMGGEDFAFYTQHLPASFIRVGSAGEGSCNLPLHNSGFDIDEDVLPIGAQILSNCAISYLTR